MKEYAYALSGPKMDLRPINALAKEGWRVIIPIRPMKLKDKDTGEETDALEFLMEREVSLIQVPLR